jgi:oxygen-dependent protoporphyrinogen oxidase
LKSIAIIGGGTSGLAAATVLDPAARAGRLEYAIFEAAPRLGGVLVTERVDGCLIDAGPDSFLTEKTWGLDFVRELGLGDQLIGSNDAERKTYIVVNGRLAPIPDGLMFMVPTKILPVLTSPLFSVATKLRMAREWFSKPRGEARDESVAEMVARHFGQEMVDRLADPLLSGVYGGDTAKLSARAVLPRFADMERRYGSLSRGMLAARKQRLAAAQNAGQSSEPRPLFTSLRGGMQQLVDTILARILPEAARVATPVVGLAHEGAAWLVKPGGGATERFDAVVLALPAPTAGALLHNVHAQLAGELTAINYSSSVIVLMGYDIAAMAHVPPGFGFLVPRAEGRRTLACTFVHKKFPHRAPPDRALVRVFLGGASDEAVLALSDDEILATVRRELRQLAGLSAEPRFVRVFRWHRAMAQYEVGHLDRVQRIHRLRDEVPGLRLAGNAYQGIGVPDAIASGRLAALETLVALGLAKPELRAAPPPTPGAGAAS